MLQSNPDPLGQTASPNSAVWKGLVVLVLLAGALVSFSGLGAVMPLDAHEVFVARTCEEMIDRGEWIVPYFNDEPRLKKPPLEYWLVLATNAVTGGDEIITEFEARFPSALAGILMAATAIAIGTLLVSRNVGLLAGAMLVTCSGYISYTHSARPEMVYAALCAAGLLCLVCAERWSLEGSRKSHATLAALLVWIFFGLATLTKGPQLPVPILIGWYFSAWRSGHLRETVRSSKPLVGSVLYLVLSLWWFVAIWFMIPEAGEIWKGETISRYVEHDAQHGETWVKMLEPYYLYRPISLLIPWVFFVPGAFVGPWLKQFKTKPGAMRLWWIILIAAVILSFSKGRRWYYMLPLLAPYTVLISSTAIQVAAYLRDRKAAWAWHALFAVHAVAIAVVAITMSARHDDRLGATPAALIALVCLAVGVYLMLLFVPRVRQALSLTGIAVGACACAAVGFAIAESRMGLWRINRHDERNFALQVSEVVGDGPLLGWRDKWEEQQYYTHRTIPLFIDEEPFAEKLAETAGAWVLVDARYEENAIPAHFNATRIISHDNGKTKGQFELWRVEPLD